MTYRYIQEVILHEFYHKLTTVKIKATHKLTTLKIINYKACDNMSNIHLTLYLMSMENSILGKSLNTWSMWLYLHTCLCQHVTVPWDMLHDTCLTENVFQLCSILNISIQKFIWSYSKKLSKENIAFNSIVCFTQTKVLAFSLKQIKQTPQIWLKIQLK